MPSMDDPSFSKTITYICTHSEDGAMGVVINRPIDLNVASLFEQLDLEFTSDSKKSTFQSLPDHLYTGGPVEQERGFILHQSGEEYDATVIVNDVIALTISKDILEAVANNTGPEKILIALGYAGWTAGQLEKEMADNAWLNFKMQPSKDLINLVFDTPNEDKFNTAMQAMGLNISNLLNTAGHA